MAPQGALMVNDYWSGAPDATKRSGGDYPESHLQRIDLLGGEIDAATGKAIGAPGDRALLAYPETAIVTSQGQSGAPVQVECEGEGNGWNTIAIHVGNVPQDRKNYATLITENMFLDFVLPGLLELGDQYGKGKKPVVGVFQDARAALAKRYKEKSDARAVVRQQMQTIVDQRVLRASE